MVTGDEIDLKGRFWNTATVNARLLDTFPGETVHPAAVVLSALVGEDLGGDPDVSDMASCRLMLAAIRLSGGDLNRLALWVEAAREDPRDLIAAAEYRRQLHGEGSSALQLDLAEYLVWVSGETAPGRVH